MRSFLPLKRLPAGLQWSPCLPERGRWGGAGRAGWRMRGRRWRSWRRGRGAGWGRAPWPGSTLTPLHCNGLSCACTCTPLGRWWSRRPPSPSPRAWRASSCRSCFGKWIHIFLIISAPHWQLTAQTSKFQTCHFFTALSCTSVEFLKLQSTLVSSEKWEGAETIANNPDI